MTSVYLLQLGANIGAQLFSLAQRHPSKNIGAIAMRGENNPGDRLWLAYFGATAEPQLSSIARAMLCRSRAGDREMK